MDMRIEVGHRNYLSFLIENAGVEIMRICLLLR